MKNMPDPSVNQARSLRDNPRHYPRKLLVKLYRPWSPGLELKDLPLEPGSLLVQAQEKLGDAILLMPCLNAFHQRFPNARIEVLCSRHNQYLFNALPFVGETLTYRADQKKLKKKLKSRTYDIFYNPKDHPSITAFRLAKLVRAEVKVCLLQPRYHQYYNHALINREKTHIIEKNAELLRQYRVKFPVSNYFPPVPKPISSTPEYSQPLIAVNLSAGSRYRAWSADNWRKLISTILENQPDLNIALFAIDKKKEIAKQLKAQFSERIHYPLESPDLLAAADILSHCRVLVSPDTSLIHVAAAMGTAVVGLYSGDTRNQWRYAPYGVRAMVLSARGLSLDTISADKVLDAYHQLTQEIDQNHYSSNDGLN